MYDNTSGGYLETNKNNSSAIYPPLYDIVHHNTTNSFSASGRSGNNDNNNNNHHHHHHHLVRSRNVTLENAHIDLQRGFEPYAYYSTFVDLYITMNAKCVIYGKF